jgi:HlyD family secretion protein
MANNKGSATRRIVWIIVGLVVVLVVLGGVGAATGFLGKRDDSTTVEVAAAEVRAITQVVTGSGKVQPEVEVSISPEISGEIIALPVREGDVVNQGTLLARIKPDFYAAQVEQAEAGVLQSKAGLAQYRADLLKAESEVRRQKELFDKHVISASAFEQAQTQHEVAKAAFEGAEFAVQSAEARLRESKEQLAKTVVYAPMSGTISMLNVELGERVVGSNMMAGTEMMRIARLDQMELEVDVNENDVVNVTLGDTAAIEIDAYPERTFKGVVTEIANSARVSAAGTQEQVTNFPVKVRVLDLHNADLPVPGNPKGVAGEEVPRTIAGAANFRPGMSGTVDIFTQTVEGVVAIPIQAVTVRDFNKAREDSTEGEGEALAEAEEAEAEDDENGENRLVKEDLRKVIFVVDAGKARMVEVETGISDDTHIEVRMGLKGGESVIIGPYRAVSRTLEEGNAVKTEEPNKRGGKPFVATR